MKTTGQKNNRKNRCFSPAIIKTIEKGKNILLFTHVSPDGDTIGSAVGLQLALEGMGKKVTVTCSDPVPQVLNYMEKAKEVTLPGLLKAGDYDLAIAVDVSDQLRLGNALSLFEGIVNTVQIDHHGTNPGYAKLNYIDESASATGILIVDLIDCLGAELTQDIAIALYTGLVIDTGNFSFNNTTAEALQVGAELVAYGVPVQDINRVLFREKTPGQITLLTKALNSLTYYNNGQIAGMWLGDKDLANNCPEDTDGIVNYALDITGVKMAFFGKETGEGIKFSLRSLVPYDVAKVASAFSGGGHPLAAGCTLEGPINQAVSAMAQAMINEMDSH